MRRQCVDRRQEDKSTRRSRSSCECYCKLKETNDESSRLSSQRFVDKNIGKKCEKMAAPIAMIDFDMESPPKQQFEKNVLESPILSPDTQKAIENAEKILEEARYKITKVAQISTSHGTKKELYTDDLELPLEDEIEENLYIRELVSSRLNKINNDVNEDSDVSKDSKKIVKNKVIKKRSIDLLAPKFRTMEHRFKPKGHYGTSVEQMKFENSKFALSSEKKNDELPADIKTCKTRSLTIQKGPPLNIDRELKKQDLGFVHISPDASYVQSNTNINFYSFSHESCKKKDTPFKSMANEADEKLVDNVATDVIDNVDRLASENRKSTEVINVLEEKSSTKNDVAVLTNVVEKTDDVLFESSINNGRRKEDRGNVSEHLPRTGVDCFMLNDELNSYYSNDVRKNEENVHYQEIKITPKICSRDVGTDVQNSLNKNEKKDKIKLFNDNSDSNSYEEQTNDEVSKKEDDIEKYRKKKMADRVNSMKNIKTIQGTSSKRSNKRNKFYEEKESTDLSDTSLQETEDISFDIELNAPSIETFDNILLVYDKVIDRVSKSDKKIENILKRLELSLCNQPLKPVVTNTAVKSYDLIPLKKTDNFHNIDKNDPILFLSDKTKSMIDHSKEDKLEINPSVSNYVLKKGDSSFLKKKCDLKNQSRLIKRRNHKIIDTIQSNESSSSIENIIDEHKILKLNRKITTVSSDEKLKNYESHKSDKFVEPLVLENDKWREKKFEFERTSINNLPSVSYTPSMFEEIMKHLQTFSNKDPRDVPTILKNFIMDAMSRESALILDFSPIEKKQDDVTTYMSCVQDGCSLQAIAQDGECKIQKDAISDSHVSQESSLVHNSDRIVPSKEKSLKVSPVNLIEIKSTVPMIDELSQTEIEVLEKGTQYEVSCEQKHIDEDNQIIKDINSDKSSMESSVDKNNKMKEYPEKKMEVNNSDNTKLQFVKNDDSEKNSKSSETNIINMDSVRNAIMKDMHSYSNFSRKILEKLSDSEDSSSRTNISNLKRIRPSVSRFTLTSSETSHSEGELYLPSSCSYSLGEIRMIKNSISMCNHAFVSTSTQSCLDETTSLLRHSSGEIYVDSSDTL